MRHFYGELTLTIPLNLRAVTNLHGVDGGILLLERLEEAFRYVGGLSPLLEGLAGRAPPPRAWQ